MCRTFIFMYHRFLYLSLAGCPFFGGATQRATIIAGGHEREDRESRREITFNINIIDLFWVV